MIADADRERRRTLGAWSTPDWLVARVLDTVLCAGPAPRSVLDPACGDGRFLAAAAARWPEARLHGVDVDEAALAAARAALGPAAALTAGDGLVVPGSGAFDLVVGNPPFLGQLARRTSRGGRSALGGGPYADAAALFLVRALALADPGRGAVALVLPQSFLATRDAGAIRSLAAQAGALEGVWIDDEGVFDAAVHTMVLSFRRGVAQGPVRRWLGRGFAERPAAVLPAAASWSPLVADLLGVPDTGAPTLGVAGGPTPAGPTLGQRAVATADFRDQYYGLVGHVGDDVDGPAFVTSGLIDPGGCSWGRRPVRFAGQRYRSPRVRVEALTPPLQAWAARRLVPKVLLATQTSVLEACADEAGALLPGVPVISVVPHDPADVWPLTAALCSPVASAWAARLAMGAGLSATALRLRAGQVGGMPLPPQPWPAAVDALRAGELEAFGRAMCTAHDVAADELLAWWLPLARRACGYGRPHA